MKIAHDLRTSQSVYTFKTTDALMKKKTCEVDYSNSLAHLHLKFFGTFTP